MARKRKKELSMRKIREILRLALENKMRNREIARSCSISHVTVGNYLKRVEKAGLSISQIEQLDDEKLRCLLKTPTFCSLNIFIWCHLCMLNIPFLTSFLNITLRKEIIV